eukprot:SAG31_NODE_3030_length_4767_cov_3.085904_3_plen_554_part_00
MEEFNKGLSKVMESDHTLLLGWNDKTIPTILELCNANESEGGGTIVVLADRDKQEMEAEISEVCGEHLRGSTVVCRSGLPVRVEDMRRCSVGTARSVIMFADDLSSPDESDARLLRVVLALIGIQEFVESDAHAVAEVRDIDNKDLIHLAGKQKVETLAAADTVGRLMLQCALQPGLGLVMHTLLGFEGSEFYMAEHPELVGVSFGSISLRFADAVPIGIKSKHTGVHLNPSDEYVLEEGDELVVLADDDDTYSSACNEFEHSTDPPPRTDGDEKGGETLLFCGWRRDMSHIVMALDQMVPKNTNLHILCSLTEDEQRHRMVGGDDDELDSSVHDRDGDGNLDLANTTVFHHQGHHVSRSALELLPLEEFHATLVLADDSAGATRGAEATDSESLACLLRIRDIVATRNGNKKHKPTKSIGPQQIISEILDSRTKDLLAISGVSEYVMSNALIASALAMIAEDRNVNGVLDELLSGGDGNEVYVRPSSRYVHPNEQASMFDVMARARQRAEVAIGYILDDGSMEPAIVRLNPPDKNKRREWKENDRIVVLAQD